MESCISWGADFIPIEGEDEESDDNGSGNSDINSEVEHLLYSYLHHDSNNSSSLKSQLNQIVPLAQCRPSSQTIPSTVSSVDILRGLNCDSEGIKNKFFQNSLVKEVENFKNIKTENYSESSRNAGSCREGVTNNTDPINEIDINTMSVVIKKCKRREEADNMTALPRKKRKKDNLVAKRKKKINRKDGKKLKVKKQQPEDNDVLSTVDELLNAYKAQMENYYNSECDDITINLKCELSGDQWHIDPEDRYARIRTHRFFNKLMFVTCNNCKNKGHLSKNCTQPKKIQRCYLCGAEGHIGEECVNAICEKCWLPGHFLEHCQWKEKDLWKECPRCFMFGHLREECPDLWRRYHLTTNGETIVPSHHYLNKKQQYCYNCGRSGHFGHRCTKRRMNAYSFPTTPFIASYSDPPPVEEITIHNKNERSCNKLHQRKKRFGVKANREFLRFTTKVKQKKKRFKKLREKVNGIAQKIDLYRPKALKVAQNRAAVERENSAEQMPCSSPGSSKKKRKRKKKNKKLNLNNITTEVISHCNNIINKFPNGKLVNRLLQKNKEKGVLKTLNGALKVKKPPNMTECDVIVLSD